MNEQHPLWELFVLMHAQYTKGTNNETKIFECFHKLAKVQEEGPRQLVGAALVKLLTEKKEIDIYLTQQEIKDNLGKFNLEFKGGNKEGELLITMIPRI